MKISHHALGDTELFLLVKFILSFLFVFCHKLDRRCEEEVAPVSQKKEKLKDGKPARLTAPGRKAGGCKS